ncbi:MAG TPA: hypothetical protein VMN57_02015 [Anaerolineales bacterium]|nr:hypothetical protein [Anaerolineales bacterium]
MIRKIFTPWTVLGALIVGLLLIGLAAWYLSYTAPDPVSPGIPTAEVAIILAPTATPPVPTAVPVTPTQAIEIPPSPLPGIFTIGAVVQIAGTDGNGLNLRGEPGLDSGIQYLGFEAEVFTIQEGPVENNGMTWWFVVGFSDPDRSGWAAANFLELVQSPD